MNAKHISTQITTKHIFQVTYDGFTYDVVIWTDAKGRFQDDGISFNGEELEREGTEGDVREVITDYLAINWESIVPA